MNKRFKKYFVVLLAFVLLFSSSACAKKSSQKDVEKREEDTQFMRLKKAKERNDINEIKAIQEEIGKAPTNTINGKQKKTEKNEIINSEKNNKDINSSTKVKKNEINAQNNNKDKDGNKKADYGSIVITKGDKVIKVINASPNNEIK